MSYTERVFGFDTRCAPAPDHPAPQWDADRRAQYLLKDVPWPLSVDEAVWLRVGSRFGVDSGLRIATPRFHSPAEARAACGPDEWAVALTAWVGSGEARVAADLGPPDPGWQRLGYDISDDVFPSGLTNCEYTPDDRAAFAARFAGALNRWHLFEDLPTAFAARDATERRAPEHTFSVIGLYRI